MEPGFARSQSSNPPHPFNGRFYLPSPHLISIWRRKPGSFRYWLWLPPSLRQLWGQIMWSPLWFFPLHYVPGDIPCLLANSAYGCPGWLSDKRSTYQCRRLRRRAFDPWVRKIPWRRKWHPTLENPMDRGAWQAMVHRVSKSRIRLKRLSMHTL